MLIKGSGAARLWIGLVDLKPLDCEAFGAAGAFTNIVTWANDINGFRQKADAVATTLEMYVVEIEEAEPIADRVKRHTLSEEIDGLVRQAESDPNAILYGRFMGTRLMMPSGLSGRRVAQFSSSPPASPHHQSLTRSVARNKPQATSGGRESIHTTVVQRCASAKCPITGDTPNCSSP